MKFTFHGHACFSFALDDGTKLLIDPFITENPLSDLKAADVQADYILLTHGHSDHLGDTIAIAKRTGAKVIAMFELIEYLMEQGISNVHGMNVGGSFRFPFGTVKMTQALHSSSLQDEAGNIIYLGAPVGLMLAIDGHVIYHAGDTSFFEDMETLGRTYPIEYAFLPIGDNFTMGPLEAARAAEKLQAKYIVPIHYDTFPVIRQDPYAFVELLPANSGRVLKPGESIVLK